MAHRVKCPTCNSCMAALWVMPNRYYYCSLCMVWYGGRAGELTVVDSPHKAKIQEIPGKIEDPVIEES